MNDSAMTHPQSWQEKDAPIDAAAEGYYGPGNAERVAAARERARRKLHSSGSRDSYTTAQEALPGSANGKRQILFCLPSGPSLCAGIDSLPMRLLGQT